MSQPPGSHSSRYESPNIVIVPTVLFRKKSPTPGSKANLYELERRKREIPTLPILSADNNKAPNTIGETIPLIQPQLKYPVDILDQTSTNKIDPKPDPESSNEDFNKSLADGEDWNKTKKANSWASNYLQSIGHNNKTPIKMSLSLSKNKIQKIKTITTTNDVNITAAQPTLNKNTELSLYDIFNATGNSPKTIENNNNINDKHMNVGNTKTVYPTTVPVNHNVNTPLLSNTDDIRTLVNSNILIDTIYTNDSNSKVPAYATLLAKSSGEVAYCYNDGYRQFDILDAIKSKINRESVIQGQTRMNLPTHKDMCEDFIKEISMNKPTSERNSDRSNSSPPTKSKELEHGIKKKSSTSKQNAKDKKTIRASSQIINKINKEQLSKNKSSLTKIGKTQKNTEQDKRHSKMQKNCTPLIDPRDFDNMIKHNLDKESDMQPKTVTHTPERPKKRVRTSSEDTRKSSSEEVTSNSSIRSVVQVADNYQMSSPKKQCLEESFDLRSKLSRANQRLNRKQPENDFNKKPKRENIKITVENQTIQKSPKKSGILKYKKRKCKKLKLIINVVCEDSDDESTSSDSCYSETETKQSQNMDLSFLDDFNVDEIVDSLKHSPKVKIKSPLPHDSKTINTDMPVELEFKPATITNVLSAKSDTYTSVKASVKSECKNENPTGNDGQTKLNMADTEQISEITSLDENVETEVNKINVTQNTHALVNILCQNKLQLHQQKCAISDENDAKTSDLESEKCNVDDTSPANELENEDNGQLMIDESVIIHENEISIIDLTDDYVCSTSGTNNVALTVTSNIIQHNMQDIKMKNKEMKIKMNSHRFVKNNNKIKLSDKKKNGESAAVALKSETAISKQKDEDIIDLTDDIVNVDQVQETTVLDQQTKPNNAQIAQIDVENNTSVDTLPSVNCNENKKTDENTQRIDSENENESNTVIPMEIDPTIETVENISPDGTEPNNLDTQIRELITKPLTEKDLKLVTHVNKHKDNVKEIAPNVPGITNSSIDIHHINKIFAQKVLDNIIENVINTKKELENISRTRVVKPESGKMCKTKDKTEIEKPSHTNDSRMDIGNECSINSTVENDTGVGLHSKAQNKELFATKPDQANAQINPGIKPIEVKPKDSALNESDTPKSNNVGDSEHFSNILETKIAQKVLDKIVENVWNNNEPENKSKSNNKIQIGKTCKTNAKKEIGNPSLTNDTKMDSIRKNVSVVPNLTVQQKALAVLLEERMKAYLKKNFKIIKHIHRGKFSNIFSCQDTNGQFYAAKVLKNENNRDIGIKKEQMIRQLQKDIPKENLNTVYLLDGFGVERYWCLLTEYYPKNLSQAQAQRKKPFHIDRVQDLARQLISAVMVLRNNNVVHSDIKPNHILLNSNNTKLKLCGFDAAYFKNYSTRSVPNIGTVSYRAPEIILGFSAGYSIDVWSTALVIYQMATNRRLFSGVFNNDILYKQMSTFGNLPQDMVESSSCKNQHFQGIYFMRRVGYKGQDAVLFDNFFKTKRMQNTLWAAYKMHWPAKERNIDMKLASLNRLLELMLLLDPRQRLAIEFVCADPFIYEMW